MGFFARFFGSADPTSEWPASSGPAPQVSFERQALESLGARLPFGANLDAARVLGRPDKFEAAGAGVYTLTYTSWGITLEFEEDRFVQVSFLIASTDGDATPDALAADVRGPDGLRLSAGTTQADIEQRFGTPSRVQTFDEETILYYTGDPLASEFQLESDRLVQWDVYLD